ncbi:VCBS domain-containing protein, partial [Leptothoe kymatousa]
DSDIDTNDILSVDTIDSSSTNGSVTDNGDGTFSYDPNGQFDVLGVGQSTTDSFSYTISDGNGGTSTANVDITITGENDAPIITPVNVDGTIEEGVTLTDTGSLTFVDIDQADTATVTEILANAVWTGGTLSPVQSTALEAAFSINPVSFANNNGTITWDYSITEPELDFLSDGETVTLNYTVTVTDSENADATQNVTITINGTNDEPVIETATATGAVTEIADGVAGETVDALTTTGNITFSDVDIADNHSITVTPDGGNATNLGALTVTPVNINSGEGKAFDWTFSVNDADVDYLAAGETLTQVYTVTVTDTANTTATQTVTITINGTNDAPVIETAVTTGAVTEIADGVAGENVDALTATGNITFSDVDIADNHSIAVTPDGGNATNLGALTVNPVNINSGDGKAFDWTFSVNDADIDYLAAGETLTQVYTVTVTDTANATATQTVTITINGTNDVPVIETATATGAVTEIADGATGETVDALTATGNITFSDVDIADNHSIAVTPDGGNATNLGVLTVNPININSGDGKAFDWTFSVNDGDVDYLAAGEALTQVYTVTVTDTANTTATQTVTITINGTNDVPVIETATATGAVTEIADGAAGETVDALTATGNITFSDVDIADNHSITVAPDGGNATNLGALTVTPVNINSGDGKAFDWTFSVNDGDIDYLAAGETLTQVYTVTVTDTANTTATQTVTITINGTNDVPVIETATATGAVTEIADGATGETVDALTATGNITFSDVDIADNHSITVAPDGGNATNLGALTVTPGNINSGEGKAFDWTFSVNDADIDYLAAGETLTQVYTVTVTDIANTKSTQTVTITINGTNDEPVIDTAVATGTVTEIADGATGENVDALTATGNITFSDVDIADNHSIAVTPDGGNATNLGALTVNPVNINSGDGKAFDWTFSVNDGDVDYLAAGETLTQVYTVTVTDTANTTATQTVTITINGTNDVPVIETATATGAVTEIADGAAGENVDALTATGNITFSDVDIADNHSITVTPDGGNITNLGALTVTPGNINSGEGKAFDWTFSVNDGDVDYLAAGETLTQVYTVTVTDTANTTATQTVTITINGTNDVPVIETATATGAVTEIADGAAGETVDALTANGNITFSDVDIADNHSITVTPDGGNITNLGALTVTPGNINNGEGKAFDWTFSVNDADIDYLAAGETLTQVYTVTVTDTANTTATQTVTITINGTNDVPVIETATATGAVTEIADGATGENVDALTATGNITFSDVDIADNHFITVTPDGGNVTNLGALTVNPVNINSGEGKAFDWTFSVNDADVDYLAAGETLTQVYTVTVTDTANTTATQTVTITINGTNDAPVIETAVATGTVTEIADGVAGETVDALTATGNLTFSDVDIADNHSITVAPDGGNATNLGALTVNPVNINSGDGKAFDWTFSINDGDIDYLAAGETLTQVYTVTVTDTANTTATQTVTITINGTNDAPVIETAVTTGAVTEIADGAAGETVDALTATGNITFSDVDITDNHSITVTPDGINTTNLGALTVNPININSGEGKAFDWTFSVNDGDIDYLAAGETLTQVYTVTVTDTANTTATQTVTITINGTNDVPVIETATATGAVTEIADGAAGETVDALTTTGNITFSDVDIADNHSITVAPDGGNATNLGALTVTPVNINSGEGKAFDWTFSVNDADIDYLAAGETLTQVYTVTVTDTANTKATQTVTITINGTNDVPVIETATATGKVTEIADGATGETVDALTATGNITFSDVDIADNHFITVTPDGGNVTNLGALTVNPININSGDGKAFDWTFSVNDADVDYLGQNDVLAQSYTVTVNDGQGGTVSQTIDLTINGTNDAPDATDDSVSVNEDFSVFANVFDDLGNGVDSDVDQNATLTVVAINGNGSTLGLQTLLPSGALVNLNADGSFTYDPNGAFGILEDSQTGTDSFTYTIADEFGAVDVATVNVTITGTDALIFGNPENELITGTDNDDILVGRGGSDVLIGGGGSDIFGYQSYGDRIDQIRDFEVGIDRIDLHEIFDNEPSRYSAAAAIDRFTEYVQLVQQGANTEVRIDLAGNLGDVFRPLITIENTIATNLSATDFIV